MIKLNIFPIFMDVSRRIAGYYNANDVRLFYNRIIAVSHYDKGIRLLRNT